MELCKSCNSKHDGVCKKEAEPKGKKLKKIGPPPAGTPGSVATTGQPSIADQIGMNKSEVIGKSFNTLRKTEKQPEPKKLTQTAEYVQPGMSFAELKKREEDMMELEDRANSLASHIKDVLKKIK